MRSRRGLRRRRLRRASRRSARRVACCAARAVDLGAVAGGEDRRLGRRPGVHALRKPCSVGASWSSANAKRPRRSSGAVVWLRPRAQTLMLRIIKFAPRAAPAPHRRRARFLSGRKPRPHGGDVLGPLDALNHLVNLLLPALAVGALSAALAKWAWRRELAGVRWRRLASWAAGAGVAATLGGLVLFGHDGRMATYGGCCWPHRSPCCGPASGRAGAEASHQLTHLPSRCSSESPSQSKYSRWRSRLEPKQRQHALELGIAPACARTRLADALHRRRQEHDLRVDAVEHEADVAARRLRAARAAAGGIEQGDRAAVAAAACASWIELAKPTLPKRFCSAFATLAT